MTPPASEPDGPVPDVTNGPSVTWLGHATAVAQLGTARVLFDPLFRRRTRAAGKVDAVLVTHSHVDHLNRWSLKAVDRETHLIVPKGAKGIVADLGFAHLTELDAGDQLEVNGVEITAVPTRHDHGRWSKGSTPVALGYVISGGGATIHHAGDVDFSDHAVFDDIGKRHAIDVAMLPIGGMLPVWYYRRRRALLDRGVHIDPDCALDIYERLGARALVPIHWGTVNLRFGSPSAPRHRLAQVASERTIGGVRILAHRERLDLAR
ncbi:MAG: Zn-dependent hydrolase of the beta-lactamase fold [Deltaproteobacteria bacterium]|nr:Zn-dependent hydrolase of the beta-lactamase fold [Deltaproteobacteria bacterium]